MSSRHTHLSQSPSLYPCPYLGFSPWLFESGQLHHAPSDFIPATCLCWVLPPNVSPQTSGQPAYIHWDPRAHIWQCHTELAHCLNASRLEVVAYHFLSLTVHTWILLCLAFWISPIRSSNLVFLEYAKLWCCHLLHMQHWNIYTLVVVIMTILSVEVEVSKCQTWASYHSSVPNL